MYWWRYITHKYHVYRTKFLLADKSIRILLSALVFFVLFSIFCASYILFFQETKPQTEIVPPTSQEHTQPETPTTPDENLPTVPVVPVDPPKPTPPENPKVNEQYDLIRGELNSFAIPFNEGASATLQDKIKQVDLALIQSLERLDIPLENFIIQDAFFRMVEGNVFHSQKIILILPENITLDDWHRVLAEQLDLWAQDAALDYPKDSLEASIFVSAHLTHTLVYAKNKEEAEKKSPELVIVIDDMGDSLSVLQEFLSLEFPVTLSIMPNTKQPEKVSALAHAFGRTVFLHQPMEAQAAVHNNDIASPLKVGMNKETIKNILEKNFAKVPNATGINNHTGSAFTANSQAVENFLQALEEVKPGITVLDSLTIGSSKLYSLALPLFPTQKRNLFLDNERDVALITKELNKALTLTETKDIVIAIGHPYPETIKALKTWKKKI